MRRQSIIMSSFAVAAFAFAAVPASAQDAPPADSEQAAQVAAGTAVVDSAGKPVGTVESVDANLAVISTGKAKVRVPVSALSKGEKGLTIGMSKAELEAQAATQPK